MSDVRCRPDDGRFLPTLDSYPKCEFSYYTILLLLMYFKFTVTDIYFKKRCLGVYITTDERDVAVLTHQHFLHHFRCFGFYKWWTRKSLFQPDETRFYEIPTGNESLRSPYSPRGTQVDGLLLREDSTPSNVPLLVVVDVVPDENV